VRIALDCTYSVDPFPSGIAVYSRQLMAGLASSPGEDEFLFTYRLKQFRQASPPRRLLLPFFPTFRADIFHALNQRLDGRPARCVISTFHDLFVMTGEYSSPEFRARFTKQAQEAARRSDWIIAVSEFTARQVAELLSFDRNRIRVVHHGVSLPEGALERRPEKMILFIGAVQTRKNVVRLVEAFERMPHDWRLVLAGSTKGYGAGEIAARIASSRARDRIRVTGYLPSEELEKLFATAMFFAFPSLDEGFGIPVLEAMIRGVPVVTSNRSALPEVAGDAALLIDPFEVDALTDAMWTLGTDTALRQQFTAKGLARAQQFTWHKATRDTHAVYREAYQDAD